MTFLVEQIFSKIKTRRSLKALAIKASTHRREMEKEVIIK